LFLLVSHIAADVLDISSPSGRILRSSEGTTLWEFAAAVSPFTAMSPTFATSAESRAGKNQ